MPYDLHDFVRELESKGLLVRIKTRVSSHLEISEIYDRVVKAGGPALLFEDVEGSDMPLLINMFGTWERMVMALGHEPAQIGKELVSLVKTKPPRTMREMRDALGKAKKLLSFPPKRVSSGVCQERVLLGDEVDLSKIPVLTCWPLDAGPFITFPQVYTRDPETGERNMGMYRMQVFDKNTTGMHWQTHKTGRAHFDKAKAMGLERLEVAVALGGDPVLTYGATAPLPPGFDEIMFCGYIRGERVPLVKCKTVDLEVPASADIILEGYIDLREPLRTEGPFGDHTGYYSLADEFPAFHVTAVTHRADAIYPTTVVGIPPQEDGPMGKATERLFLELMRLQIPELVDMNMPVEGGFHNLMIVSIKKRYPGHARKAMMSLWGAGLVALEKVLVIVDEDVDVHDPAALLEAFGKLDALRDVLLVDQMPTDTLDHAAPAPDLGSHVGIDLTRPLAGEPPRVEVAAASVPALVSLQASVPELVAIHQPAPRLLFASIRKTRAGQARDVIERLWKAGVPDSVIPIIFEADVDIADGSAATFHATANLDPARDMRLERVDAAGHARLGVDATIKMPEENARVWPPIIQMDSATKALVDARWASYGIALSAAVRSSR